MGIFNDLCNELDKKPRTEQKSKQVAYQEKQKPMENSSGVQIIEPEYHANDAQAMKRRPPLQRRMRSSEKDVIDGVATLDSKEAVAKRKVTVVPPQKCKRSEDGDEILVEATKRKGTDNEFESEEETVEVASRIGCYDYTKTSRENAAESNLLGGLFPPSSPPNYTTPPIHHHGPRTEYQHGP